ncbi:alkaline shock response membrane anchor protein AmaP [Streptomyces sp. Rer75]|uniref:alkaline shock response membrane anchor protein AmaP n=1 Tax=unclassified Streptomyces TaxID=2593676 RepID=UPI0015CFD2CB|nr:alkaline shock response membrane anchor protein AmaP [Streptomyces sp. Rer75]QLH20956.1 alkaline shock response membrane anchor protein AmaP [Streptomyces sp. Rer75]
MRIVNRTLLGVLGLALAGAGAAVLLAGRRSPNSVLLTRADRVRWRAEDWWWPGVIAALSVLVLLALWWALAQLRRRRLDDVLVPLDDGTGARLRGRALEAALRADAESLSGVAHAHVHLHGRRTAPRARVGLVLDARAEPVATLRRLESETLTQARTSAGLPHLPAEVRLRGEHHKAERAR